MKNRPSVYRGAVFTAVPPWFTGLTPVFSRM